MQTLQKAAGVNGATRGGARKGPFWVGDVEQKHGNPTLVSKRTCLISDSALIIVAEDEVLVRHIPLSSIGKFLKYEDGWYMVKHRSADLAIRTKDDSFEPAFRAKWKRSHLAPAPERARLPRFALHDIPSADLRSSLSVFYQFRQRPEILWAGWMWRRERLMSDTHSKRLLILTCNAVYVGRTSDVAITRCIPLDMITTVSVTRDEHILFKVPMEYDLVVKEPTRVLHRTLSLLFKPIQRIDGVSNPLNGYSLVEPPAFIACPPLPITAEVDESGDESRSASASPDHRPLRSFGDVRENASMSSMGLNRDEEVEISFRVPEVDAVDADLQITVTSARQLGASTSDLQSISSEGSILMHSKHSQTLEGNPPDTGGRSSGQSTCPVAGQMTSPRSDLLASPPARGPEDKMDAVLSPPEAANSLMTNGSRSLMDARRNTSFGTASGGGGGGLGHQSLKLPGYPSSSSNTPRVGIGAITTPTWYSNRTRTSTIASFSGLDVSLPMISNGGSDTLHWASEVMGFFDKSCLNLFPVEEEDEMIERKRSGADELSYNDTLTTAASPRASHDIYIMYLTDSKIKLTHKKYDIEIVAKCFDLDFDAAATTGQVPSLCASSSFSSPLRRGIISKLETTRHGPTRCEVRLELRADDKFESDNPPLTSPVSTMHSRFGMDGPPTSRSSMPDYCVEDYFIFTPTVPGKNAKIQKIDDFLKVLARLTNGSKEDNASPRELPLGDTIKSESDINNDMRCDYEGHEKPSPHSASTSTSTSSAQCSDSTSTVDSASGTPATPQKPFIPLLNNIHTPEKAPFFTPVISPRKVRHANVPVLPQGLLGTPGSVPTDEATGLPLVSFPSLDPMLQRDLAALYEDEHQPDILWAGYVRKVLAHKPAEPSRILLLSPRCVYLLAANVTIVACLPLEDITELRVDHGEGLAPASLSLPTPRGTERPAEQLGQVSLVLRCPSQCDLMLRLVHGESIRMMLLVLCSAYRVATGRNIRVQNEYHLDAASFDLSLPEGRTCQEAIPISRMKLAATINGL